MKNGLNRAILSESQPSVKGLGSNNIGSATLSNSVDRKAPQPLLFHRVQDTTEKDGNHQDESEAIRCESKPPAERFRPHEDSEKLERQGDNR